MTGWILNIVGMVFIGVMLEIILPSGKTNGFIKSIFAIFLLYTIISPLPQLFNSELNLNTNATVIDDNFIISLNLEKVSALENSIVEMLAQNGYENVSVIVSANIYSSTLEVKKVYVDLVNVVLKNTDKHININEHIKLLVTQLVSVSKEDVVIYE